MNVAEFTLQVGDYANVGIGRFNFRPVLITARGWFGSTPVYDIKTLEGQEYLSVAQAALAPVDPVVQAIWKARNPPWPVAS